MQEHEISEGCERFLASDSAREIYYKSGRAADLPIY